MRCVRVWLRISRTAGCIVAAQSDNETCYLFHDQTYATDYSADSLKLYRSFLRRPLHHAPRAQCRASRPLHILRRRRTPARL